MLQFNLQANIELKWEHCAKLPTDFCVGKATVINGKVYCGGGATDNEYIVYCCDPSQDKWSTLPQLPVRRFGLGQVNGKLVAVGGLKGDGEGEVTNQVCTYESSQRSQWRRDIPLMPTARHSPDVLSLEKFLIVAGGDISHRDETDIVEVFNPDTSQWYRTDSLPAACRDMPFVAIGNKCYLLGGYKYPSRHNQALYASLDDLLRNAVPADQATHRDRHDRQSAWKMLPNTPTYQPAAAILAGNLLAIGGKETSGGGADKGEVYRYSSSTNSWICMSHLPAPRSRITIASLSSTEILVIGGWCDGNVVKSMYKCKVVWQGI